MQNGHRKEILKLMFRALALHPSLNRGANSQNQMILLDLLSVRNCIPWSTKQSTSKVVRSEMLGAPMQQKP